jgi:ABC-type antimicrobial peptide transport system permease subunit
VINEALVRVSFASADPLGRSITVGFLKNPCRVVGVVGDVRLQLDEPPDPAIYVPFDQVPFWDASFVVRGKQGTAALIPLLRDVIRSVDRQLPVHAATLSQQVELSVAGERFRTTLVGLFAALAILLAAVGISGVMGYSVSRRTQEIGLRMALGATPREVLREVVREGLRLSLIGGVFGIAAALALSRFLRSLLYGVGPADAVTYAGVALLLAVVSLLACALPALRAARVDPTVALRYE